MAGLIFTANFGSYDSPKALGEREEGIDYYLFSDVAKSSGWDLQWKTLGERSPQWMARYIKVMVPHALPNYDWHLWLDATMAIKAPVLPLVEKLLASEHDFAAHRHNEWPCAYMEISKCLERKKDKSDNLLKARALLEEEKLPKNFGQAATGVLWRRNTEAVREHALAWWLDMQATTMRDQATFMLNLFSKRIYLEWLPGSHLNNKYFRYHRGHLK